MHTINEVATWFKENNILAAKDQNRIITLSLYTKIAFKLCNKDLKCTEISFANGSFNIGITNTDTPGNWSSDELQIIETINHCYGYENLKYLFLKLAKVKNCNIENITNYLKDDILDALESYKDYTFNEYVLIFNDNIFFINKNTILTDAEKELLSTYDNADQNSYIVFRDENNGKLVVY